MAIQTQSHYRVLPKRKPTVKEHALRWVMSSMLRRWLTILRWNLLNLESRFYTVKSGDSLSKIAKEMYGNANDYMKIFDANKPMLSDPNKIYPGQVLRIPQ